MMSGTGILLVAMVVMMILMCGGMVLGAGAGIAGWLRRRRENSESRGEPAPGRPRDS